MSNLFRADMPKGFTALTKARNTYSNFGSTMRACLRAAIGSYNIWFWFTGIRILDKNSVCMAQIFLFVPFNLESRGLRDVFRISAILYSYLTLQDTIEAFWRIFIGIYRALTGAGRKLLVANISIQEVAQLAKRVRVNLWSTYVSMNLSSEETKVENETL